MRFPGLAWRLSAPHALLLLICPPLLAQDTVTAFDGRREVMADGSRGPYRLGDRPLVEGSERIRVEARRMVRGEDYTMDYSAAEVTFERGVPRGKVIHADYRVVPEFLKPIYRHRIPASPDSLSPLDPPAVPDPPLVSQAPSPGPDPSPDSTGILVGGSKTFSVSLGSDRDATLNQSLRLNLSGKLGGDVEILGVLSDRNLPIQPDGTTRVLSQLDQVLLQVRSRNLSAGVGDLSISFTETELARYERRIQGVTGEALLPNGRLTLFGAAARGSFYARQVPSLEGSQGPYAIAPRNRILAGSERVFLDGELLSRGLGEDYAIDYDAGTISFTPRRPISADSRILVEAQEAEGLYGRTVVGGRGKVAVLGSRLSIGATAIRESDTRVSPLTSPFHLPKSVGPLTLPDSPAAQDLIPSPVDTLVAAPSRSQVVAVDLNASPHPSLNLQGEFAASDLNLDLTSRAPARLTRGCAFRAGLDLLPIRLARPMGSLALSTRVRVLSDRFSPVGRTRPVESQRLWGVGLRPAGEKSVEMEGTYRLTDASGVRGSFGKGRWGDETSWRRGVSLYSGEPRGPRFGLETEEVRLNAIAGGEGRLRRRRANLEQVLRGLRPFLRVESELAEGTVARNLAIGRAVAGNGTAPSPAGEAFSAVSPAFAASDWRYREVGGGLAYGDRAATARGASIFSEWTVRHTDRRSGPGWSDSASVSSQRLRLSLPGFRTLSLAGDYTHRSRRSYDRQPVASSDHLAEGRLTFSPRDGGISQEVFYRLSSTRTEGVQRLFVEVGRGHGTFTWVDLDHDGRPSDGEYLPDPDGAYGLFTEHIGLGDPAGEAAFGTRLAVDFGKIRPAARQPGKDSAHPDPPPDRPPSAGRRLLSALSFETSLDADRRVLKTGGEGTAPWSLGGFSAGPGVVSGRRSFQQDLFLHRYGRLLSLRARYRRDDSISREYSAGDLRSSAERSLRLRARLRAGLDAEVEVSDRSRLEEGPVLRYDLRSVQALSRTTWRTGDLLMLLTLSGGRDRDLRSGLSSRFVSIAPEVIRNFLGSGRLRTSAGWTRTSASPGFPLYLALTQGRRPGETLTWEVAADLRMGRVVTVSSAYTGRKTPGLPPLHLGQAEVQASF